MDIPRWISSALILPLVLVSLPAAARTARRPEIVAPPFIWLDGKCPAQVETPGGTRIGAAIPVPALRLGAPVSRGPISYDTGGSGTAKFAEIERRKRAGLPYAPRTFDVAGSARPEVFADDAAKAVRWQPYQQLPLKNVSPHYDPYGLIFAQATSPTTGRIVSLQLTLRKAPAANPKLRVTAGARPDATGCAPSQGLDVYTPATSADRIRSLFATSGCSWYRLEDCKRSEWPRGRVLFVQRQGSSFVHRWIDYDLLAKVRFGRRSLL